MLNILGISLDKNEVLTKKLHKLARSLQLARDENNALRAMDRKEFREDYVVDRVLDIFSKNVKKFKPVDYVPTTVRGEVMKNKWGNIVGVSDWHIGEDVSEEEVNGSNEFNYKVAQKRITKYIESISSKQTSENLIIADLGDNIRGIIHGGIEDTEGGLMESIVKAVDLQVMFINAMLSLYNKIDYRFVVGNHSRLDDHIKSKNKYKDYSWLITQMLMRLYTDEGRITFHISKSGFHLIKVNTANILLFHGDTLRSYNPNQNGSRLNAQDNCVGLFKKSARHFFSGHKHIAMNIQNQWEGVNIISGTLVGNNEYGVQNGFSTISSSQCMFNVQQDGKIEEIYHFNLK